jgi:NAD-dependent SIR2 family protein deacetylase
MIGGKAGQVCQLHGDIHTLRCDYCNAIQEYRVEWMEMLLEGEAPDCPECSVKCKPPPNLRLPPEPLWMDFDPLRFNERSARQTTPKNRDITT